MLPHIQRIEIFPIKSLSGIVVDSMDVLPSGALRNDRALALFDDEGVFINGKRCDLIHAIRAEFSPDLLTVRLRHLDGLASEWFALEVDNKKLELWLGEHLKRRIHLQSNRKTGFPDDLDSPGPTIVATSTLETVAEWFPGIGLAEMRRRIRCNIEIGGVPPFWEDQLCGPKGTPRPFSMGPCTFHGINPCQRCNVPQKDSLTGQKTEGFAELFARRRREAMPPWAQISQFNHFYRLCINTCVPNPHPGATLRVGDEIRL